MNWQRARQLGLLNVEDFCHENDCGARTPFGENLSAGWKESNGRPVLPGRTATEAVNAWYCEKDAYDFANPNLVRGTTSACTPVNSHSRSSYGGARGESAVPQPLVQLGASKGRYGCANTIRQVISMLVRRLRRMYYRSAGRIEMISWSLSSYQAAPSGRDRRAYERAALNAASALSCAAATIS